MKFSEGFLERFNSPKAYRYAILAGILVALPTLMAGLFLDDYVHILTIEGKAHLATPSEVFQFAPGNPEIIRDMMNTGPYPWFVLPDLSIRFMRPLSSALMRLDYYLFGRNAFGYHVHALLWYALCLLIVSRLFKNTLPFGLGALALLLYALDIGHLVPVGWWSNRNSLVSAVPAMLGLLCHFKYRESDWQPGLPLSILFYAIGLAGGETALGIFGYLIAYELVAARGSYIKRFFMLVPAGLLGLIYILLYKSLDYGTHGSGIYIDPTRDPLEFLLNAPARLILIVAGHFAMLPSELPMVVPRSFLPLVAVAFGLVLVMVRLVWLAWPLLEEEHRRHVRWFLLGAFISSLPILATFPSIRLLMLPSLGLNVALAMVLWYLFSRGLEALPQWQKHTARALVVLHLFLPPLIWLGFSVALRAVDSRIQYIFQTAEYDHENVEQQHIMILHSENPVFGFYPMIAHMYYGYPEAKSWWPLSMAPFTHLITRTEDQTFEVEIEDGEMLTTDFERLLRATKPRFKVGEQVKIEGMTVTILEMGKLGPHKFRVEVDKSLDDPQYLFLAWQEKKLMQVEMPAVGETLRLELQGWF